MKYIVNNIVWGWPLLILLLLVSVYFLIRTRFVQFRYLKLIPKLFIEKNDSEDKISAYQTVALVLANHIGTGNIVGVAIAILYGGPGAIFWMWVTALITSSLSFVENTLGQLYKTEINGEYRGGAAYYILKGIGSPFWAHFVSFLFFICLGLFMPTIQSATISEMMSIAFNVPKIIIGIIVTGVIGFIIFGNAKRIVHFAEVIVPFMAISYLLIAIIVILYYFSYIDDVFKLIIVSAFNRNAIFGSIIGSAIGYGIRRSMFTNEAGIGSSPNISASSNVSHPIKQGLLSSFCIFIDTIFICTATAFMIIITKSYNVIHEGKYLYIGLPEKGYNDFVSTAINIVFTNLGTFFVTIAIFLFGFTSIFGSFYNAQTNLIFMFRDKKYKFMNFLYKCSFLLIIFLSAIYKAELAWDFTDLGVGIAAFVNVIVLLILNHKVIEAQKDFELKYKKKQALNYENLELECWRKR